MNILIVEDDNHSIMILCKIIYDLGGFDIITGNSVEKVMNSIHSQDLQWTPDIVFSDFFMNDYNGFDFLRDIRNEFVTEQNRDIFSNLLTHQKKITITEKPHNVFNIREILCKNKIIQNFEKDSIKNNFLLVG
jgi:response regulator of citrate/malate metabolism